MWQKRTCDGAMHNSTILELYGYSLIVQFHQKSARKNQPPSKPHDKGGWRKTGPIVPQCTDQNPNPKPKKETLKRSERKFKKEAGEAPDELHDESRWVTRPQDDREEASTGSSVTLQPKERSDQTAREANRAGGRGAK